MKRGQEGRRFVAAVGAGVILLLGAACSGGDTYDEFKSAVDSGASCSELFDQRSNFSKEEDLEKIDADLERIGCDDPSSERTD